MGDAGFLSLTVSWTMDPYESLERLQLRKAPKPWNGKILKNILSGSPKP